MAAALSVAAIVLCAGPPTAGATVTESTSVTAQATVSSNTDFAGQTFTVPASATDTLLHTLQFLSYQRNSGTYKVYVTATTAGGLPTGAPLYESPTLTTAFPTPGVLTVFPNITLVPGTKYAMYTEASFTSNTTFGQSGADVYADGTKILRIDGNWAISSVDLAFRAQFSAGKGATQTTVSNCVGPIKIGVTTSCTATVSNGGTGFDTPTGDVTFSSSPSANAVPPGSCTLAVLVVNVSAKCDYFFTPGSGSSGSQTVFAQYGAATNGDPDHLPSSTSTSITVNKRTSQLDTSCVPATITLGQSATCTATVADNDSALQFAPAGNVTWTGGSGSFSPSASCALTPVNAAISSCAVTYTPSAAGFHAITSNYAGGTNHLAALPGGANLTVNPPAVAPPDCTALQSKLKKLKKKLKKADDADTKKKLRKKIRKVKRELAALGC